LAADTNFAECRQQLVAALRENQLLRAPIPRQPLLPLAISD
jgi:hypothetical protein